MEMNVWWTVALLLIFGPIVCVLFVGWVVLVIATAQWIAQRWLR